MRHVGTVERRALLAERHRLRPEQRTDDVVAIASDVVALHSSDPATVFLSAFARMDNPSAELVEHALYSDRTLLRFHAMRRTIWVATPRLVEAMNASSTRKVAANERRLLLRYLANNAQVDDPEAELERLTAMLVGAVKTAGSITTRELGLQQPELAKKITIGSGKGAAEVGAHGRVAALAGFEARLIRGRPTGSWVASEYTWHPMNKWVDIDFDAMDERTAMATVGAAYLARFGPATTVDLRWWTGWTATATNRALADIGAVEVSLDDGTAWVVPDDPLLDTVVGGELGEPWVAVLPGLDATTMGWKQRDWFLDGPALKRVFDRNGNAGPTIWRNGEVVGGWVQRPDGELRYEFTHKLDAQSITMLESELERMQAAIGDIRFRVRFPSPNQKDLLA